MAILLGVAGLGGTTLINTLGDNVDALFPGHGKQVVAIAAAAATASAIILRVVYNQTPPPGTSLVIAPAEPPTTPHA